MCSWFLLLLQVDCMLPCRVFSVPDIHEAAKLQNAGFGSACARMMIWLHPVIILL